MQVAPASPLVRRLEHFTALSEADRAALERLGAEARPVAARTELVREGDRLDGAILVLDGLAYRHTLRVNGARQISAYLVPGDLTDPDLALLGPADHAVTAASACRVVRIAPDALAPLMQQNPAIARALRVAAQVEAATLRTWLLNIARRTAVERIAHLFCELLVRLQAVGRAGPDGYDLPLTQTDLADTTGLTSVHVNRSLQLLRRQNLIDLGGRRLRILNLDRLQALAEFRAGYLHLENPTAA